LRILARRHEITLCHVGTTPARADIVALASLGVTVEVIPFGRVVGWARMLRGAWDRRPFESLPVAARHIRHRIVELADGVDVVHAQLVRSGPLLAGLHVPIVIDLVDALSMNLERRSSQDRGPRRWAAAWESRRLLPYERSLVAAAAGTAVSTSDDASAIAASGIEVVPNGVDLDGFSFRPHPRPAPVVVFAGNLGYFPNVDAAVELANSIMPAVRKRVPAARLVLAGARPARAVRRLTSDHVTVVAEPDDLAPLVGAAAVAVVPMRVGTGIQNKVLEAMAAGTPVVTTKRVADAVGAVHAQHLLMADGAVDFADATVRVMTDVDLASSLAIAARRLVEEQFPWEVSASGIERLWERAAGLHR